MFDRDEKDWRFELRFASGADVRLSEDAEKKERKQKEAFGERVDIPQRLMRCLNVYRLSRKINW